MLWPLSLRELDRDELLRGGKRLAALKVDAHDARSDEKNDEEGDR